MTEKPSQDNKSFVTTAVAVRTVVYLLLVNWGVHMCIETGYVVKLFVA